MELKPFTNNVCRGILLSVMMWVGMAGCAKKSMTCDDVRPTQCDDVYEPVCATTATGRQLKRASACSACIDTNVVSYVEGACTSDDAE